MRLKISDRAQAAAMNAAHAEQRSFVPMHVTQNGKASDCSRATATKTCKLAAG